MSKKIYKQLQKKLKNEFTKLPNVEGYDTVANVFDWLQQCGIKDIKAGFKIICLIFGSVPYPYQPNDRKVILKYLKKNKYKDYKNGKLKIN